MKQEFYEKLLPSKGVYCVVGIKDGVVKQHFANSLNKLLTLTEQIKDKEQNVYVAPNSFKGHSRKGDQAMLSRSFFVDLDVGNSPKKYPNKEVALEALNTFVFANDMPPPVVISSGTGIQAYWIFDEDIDVADWLPYAEKFKDYCFEQGLLIDAAVTADVARIMRCPNTFNYKTNPPAPTEFITDEIHQYSFDAFKEFLGEVEVKVDYNSVLLGAKKGLDEGVDIFKNENFEYEFSEIAVKSLEGKGCNQIKFILENPNECPEPLWYAGLSVAVRCIDGAEAIHQMSEGHDNYNHAETEYKAKQSLENASWAHSCSVFEKENPAGCLGCPLKGKLRSKSPIDIGRKFVEAEEPTETVTEGNDEKPFAFPLEIRPFVRGRTGGVYFLPPPDENGDREDPICLIQDDLYPIKRVWAGVDKECLLIRYILPHDPVREFLLPLKFLCTFDKLKQILFENGVNFHVSQTPKMFDYLNKWSDYLKRKEVSEIMRQQMGWTEEKNGFVLGGIEITKGGGEIKSAVSPMIKNVSKLVRPVGDYQTWKRSANSLNQKGFEIISMGLLQGFGSPLMHLTSTPGASICYQSTDSGVGKTGALYAGLSVFCDPYNSSLLEGNSTENAHIGRYLAMKNMLFGIDEASNIPPDMLSKIIHRISQGKAKLRMQSSVNAERDLEMSASLQGIFTSNQSLIDKLFSLKASPQGEIARLIEFSVKKPKALEEDSLLGRKIFDPFRTNYGWAGPDFIRYLYKIGDGLTVKAITKWNEQFNKDYGSDSAYRFYANLIATSFAGGELAGDAGIISLDLDRIYDTVMLSMVQTRDQTIKPSDIDYKSLISDFFYRNLNNFLIFNDEENLIGDFKGNNLVGRIEAKTGCIYVHRGEMRKFILDRQISTREFELVLKKEGLLLGTEQRRLSKGWRSGTGATPPVTVYIFKSIIDVSEFERE